MSVLEQLLLVISSAPAFFSCGSYSKSFRIKIYLFYLFFSQHRIASKLIKIVNYIYFQQIDTLTRIVPWLELNVGINQNWSFTVVSVIVSLYLWHKGSHSTYQVHCTSRMSQLLCDFVCISQDLIFEVPSRYVSKEKLDLSSRKLSHIQNY